MFPPEYIKSESHDLGKDVCRLGWLDFWTNQEGFHLHKQILFFLIRLESTARQWVRILKRHKIQFAYFYCNIPMLIKVIVTHSDLTFWVDYESARPHLRGKLSHDYMKACPNGWTYFRDCMSLIKENSLRLITSKIWNNQSEWRSFFRIVCHW